jgi:hypothetical protein
MNIRDYVDSDWESVRGIHDLSEPDEMRGSGDLSAILSPGEFVGTFNERDVIAGIVVATWYVLWRTVAGAQSLTKEPVWSASFSADNSSSRLRGHPAHSHDH